MDNKFSKASFDSLSQNEIRATLHELRQYIQSKIDEVTALDVKDKSIRFNEVVDKVVAQLKELGHSLFNLDYDGDIRYSETNQAWGSAYYGESENGLNIFFHPYKLSIKWEVIDR